VWKPVGRPLSGLSEYDWLGSAVDLSKDGSVLVASAPHDVVSNGYVLAWQWDGLSWTRLGGKSMVNNLSLSASNDRFGQSVCLSETTGGTYRLAVGVPFQQVGSSAGAGIALVYEYNLTDSLWHSVANPVYHGSTSDEFGTSVQLTSSGNKLVVGSPGYANRIGLLSFYTFNSTLGIWENTPQSVQGIHEMDDFGQAVAVSNAGNGQILIAAGAMVDASDRPGYVLNFAHDDI
jgi:hypothetical protein